MKLRSCRCVLILLLCVGVLPGAGCSGLFVWNIGKYYRTELDTTQTLDTVFTVGIYVFSEGPAFSTATMRGLDAVLWPPRVTKSMWVEPDTSNIGPSLELAYEIRDQLNRRGYQGVVVEDMDHSGIVQVEACIANAQARELDAAMVVFYSGLHTWREPDNCMECWEFYTLWRTRVNPLTTLHRGFLYLPNAAIFNPANGSTIWSTSYYGIVQEAHIPNLSNESFSTAADLAVLPSSDIDYLRAAPKTARLMFDPLFWPDSFKELPRHIRRGRTL